MTDRSTTPPGWHDDPEQPGMERHWDGSRWTDNRRAKSEQPPPPPTAITVQTTGNGIAVAAMVCAIVGALFGLTLFFFMFALVLGLLGIVFGVAGGRRVRRGETQRGKGMARTGIIVGVIAIALGIVGVILSGAFEDRHSDLDEIHRDQFPEGEIDQGSVRPEP
ncbi:MAG: DUF4190 domain-containing protein [Acidobacteria bacterium]|nr:DUF4190 domain-containing protein [Acidobacteriota bacterium]